MDPGEKKLNAALMKEIKEKAKKMKKDQPPKKVEPSEIDSLNDRD